MADIQKVSVALTGEQLAALKAAVEAGEYCNDERNRARALRDWQYKRDLRQEELKRLRETLGRGQGQRAAGAA